MPKMRVGENADLLSSLDPNWWDETSQSRVSAQPTANARNEPMSFASPQAVGDVLRHKQHLEHIQDLLITRTTRAGQVPCEPEASALACCCSDGHSKGLAFLSL